MLDLNTALQVSRPCSTILFMMKEARMAICEAEAARAGTAELNADYPRDYFSAQPPASYTRDCTDIMGVLIDRTNRAQVLRQIDTFVRSGSPHQIVTVNVDFLNIAHQDHSFVRLLNDAAVSVPDGMPLLWVSRVVGQRLPERITGTDLLCGCAELAAREGYRMFLLGAAPGVADHAAQVLTTRYPGLQIVGTYSPPEQGDFDADENARIVEVVRAARPDMLFVALGTPKQEKWIYTNLQDLGVPVCIGVGGVFNFITGRIQRAPEAMQRAGMEWLFRLCLEPRRLWRRYLIDDTKALYRAMHYATRKRVRGLPGPVHTAPITISRMPTAPAHPLLPDAPDWHLGTRDAVVSSVVGMPEA
ncbi:MAG TPA: WecB/TagA/CpsF family glycosyltransferase [Chloroflexia bacterium]|nr:WecB/TagA/CpsF family glycosyltransferase [Chloroflexia bacterium]